MFLTTRRMEEAKDTRKKNYRKRSASNEEIEDKDGEQLKREESDDERERRFCSLFFLSFLSISHEEI